MLTEHLEYARHLQGYAVTATNKVVNIPVLID